MHTNAKQIKSYEIKNVRDFKTTRVIYKLYKLPNFKSQSFNIKTFTLNFLIYIGSCQVGPISFENIWFLVHF